MWDEEQERIDAQAAQEALVSNLEKQQKRLEAAEQTIAKLVEAAEVVNTKACWDRVLAHAILEAKQFLEQP